jgi:hypothetical protein
MCAGRVPGRFPEDRMAQIDTTDPAFPVFCQLLGAFAQGAGTMPIAKETMAQIVTDYWGPVSGQTGFTETLLQAMEYARGLGRIASHRAATNGFNVVRVEDYNSVKQNFASTNIHPFQDCPFC